MTPTLLFHPIACLTAASFWDKSQGLEGWLQYGLTCTLMAALCAATLISSHTGLSADKESDAVRSKLALQV